MSKSDNFDISVLRTRDDSLDSIDSLELEDCMQKISQENWDTRDDEMNISTFANSADDPNSTLSFQDREQRMGGPVYPGDTTNEHIQDLSCISDITTLNQNFLTGRICESISDIVLSDQNQDRTKSTSAPVNQDSILSIGSVLITPEPNKNLFEETCIVKTHHIDKNRAPSVEIILTNKVKTIYKEFFSNLQTSESFTNDKVKYTLESKTVDEFKISILKNTDDTSTQHRSKNSTNIIIKVTDDGLLLENNSHYMYQGLRSTAYVQENIITDPLKKIFIETGGDFERTTEGEKKCPKEKCKVKSKSKKLATCDRCGGGAHQNKCTAKDEDRKRIYCRWCRDFSLTLNTAIDPLPLLKEELANLKNIRGDGRNREERQQDVIVLAEEEPKRQKKEERIPLVRNPDKLSEMSSDAFMNITNLRNLKCRNDRLLYARECTREARRKREIEIENFAKNRKRKNTSKRNNVKSKVSMFNKLAEEDKEKRRIEEEDDNDGSLLLRAVARLKEQTGTADQQQNKNKNNETTLEENTPDEITILSEDLQATTTTQVSKIQTTTTVVEETTSLKIFSNSQEAGTSKQKPRITKKINRKTTHPRQQIGEQGKKAKTKGELYEEIKAKDVIITALKGSIGLLKEQAKIQRKDTEKLERYLLNLERNLIAREHPDMGLSETQFLLSHNSHDEIIRLKHDLHSAIELIKNLDTKINISGEDQRTRILVERDKTVNEDAL